MANLVDVIIQKLGKSAETSLETLNRSYPYFKDRENKYYPNYEYNLLYCGRLAHSHESSFNKGRGGELQSSSNNKRT